MEKINPSTIAATANTLGWRTKNGNRWTARQVLFTLSNHVYAGLIANGYGYRDGCHKGLVEQKAFHQVQSILAGRKTGSPSRGRLSIPWILRGLVICGGCGRPLSTHTIHRGLVVYRYYRCRSTAGGKEPCKGVMISAGEIENAVLEALGVGQGLTSKEEEAAVRAAIRQVVYQPATGLIEMEFQPEALSNRDDLTIECPLK